MADSDGWVNAEVTLVIPLDTVKPSDSQWAKQEALCDAIERVADALPPELAECCGFGRWEDVEAEATPPARQTEKPSTSDTPCDTASDRAAITLADRCEMCEGTRRIMVRFGGSLDSAVPCPSCGGTGRTETTP